jgi:hypothetical protein
LAAKASGLRSAKLLCKAVFPPDSCRVEMEAVVQRIIELVILI